MSTADDESEVEPRPNERPRSALSIDQARAFLGLSAGPDDGAAETLPADEDALLDAIEDVVDAHEAVAIETAPLAPQGLQLSPIWELRDGAPRARLAVRPPALRARFLTRAAFDALDDVWIDALLFALPWFEEDPVGAAHALEDTHRVWFDAEAPTRPLDVRRAPGQRLVSMALADLGRKKSAGFSAHAWLASLGLPIDAIIEALGAHEDTPNPEAIARDVRERSLSMWAEELRWKRAAFGRPR